MAKKGDVYRDVLAKPPPIKMSIFDLHPSDAAHPLHPATVAALLERQAALEDALFKDCDVERGAPNAWKRVALVLAERHVPAFGPDLEKSEEGLDEPPTTMS